MNVTLLLFGQPAFWRPKAGAELHRALCGALWTISTSTGWELIAEIRQIYDNYDFPTEILTASIRTPNHMKEAALLGADVATAPPAVIKAMADHVLTDKGLDAFLKDWAKTGQKIL